MNEPSWADEYDDDHWDIITDPYIIHVTEEQAQRAIAQFTKGEKMLEFIDIHGSVSIIPREYFKGAYSTSTEIRSRVSWYEKYLKGYQKPEWEE